MMMARRREGKIMMRKFHRKIKQENFGEARRGNR
jgi:hypothetical protein